VIGALSENATPEQVAVGAESSCCKSEMFADNEPVPWAESAIDTARACREGGIKAVALTAGYITPEARSPSFEVMDAANLERKGLTKASYQEYTSPTSNPHRSRFAGCSGGVKSGSRSPTS
jgi:pyruvate formate lyase activating enzyme